MKLFSIICTFVSAFQVACSFRIYNKMVYTSASKMLFPASTSTGSSLLLMSATKKKMVDNVLSNDSIKRSSDPARGLLKGVSKLPIAKKYVLVTGGVISGIGKGITASSIGVLLKMLNIRTTAIKIDPYLNVDAGTMSPFEHGEVFVLDDGSETDLDLGNYERFLDIRLTSDSNLTTGKVYESVIAKERKGEYLGKTVQIIPHITNEIIRRITSVSTQAVSEGDTAEPDVCVIELGGTVGDIESMPFVEALRQLQLLVKPENFCIVHVSMVPIIGESGEQKTKPTQHSVKEMRSLGLSPDFIVCRAPKVIEQASREKISLFCNVPVENVLSIHDVPNIYHVPNLMLSQQFHTLLSARLGLEPLSPAAWKSSRTKEMWNKMVTKIDSAAAPAIIALVGKYTNLSDSYLSVVSALKHACIETDQKLVLEMIDSTCLEKETQKENPEAHSDAWNRLRKADGVLVPGGFGIRGIEGKIEAIRYAREEKVPFLGVCLGMQAAVIEFARNQLKVSNANSKEFAPLIPDMDAAIIFMPEGSTEQFGGTMRLGSRTTVLRPGSLAAQLYDGKERVDERHRHRYEVNPTFVDALEKKGLRLSGKDVKGERMEIVELDKEKHPYFIGTQFHPEFKSRPQRPAPVFLGLLQAVKNIKGSMQDGTSDTQASMKNSATQVKSNVNNDGNRMISRVPVIQRNKLLDPTLLGESSLRIPTSLSSSENSLSVSIEYCKSCASLKTRAFTLEALLRNKGVTVLMNPEPPRKGSFVVSIEVGSAGSITLLELLDMPRPFKELKALNMDDIAEMVLESLL